MVNPRQSIRKPVGNVNTLVLTPQQFLEGLYCLHPGEAMPPGVHGWIATFATTVEDASRHDWRGVPWPGGDPLVTAFGRESWERRNAYAVISAFRYEDDGYAGRRKHLAVASFAVMLDDVGTKVPAERACALPPSYVVETSPGNRQHWLFLEPEFDTERVARALDAMVRAGLAIDGTDPGMRGITRYGRAPFGVNLKRKYGPQGFPVRLVEWQPQQRYALGEVERAFKLKLATARPRPAPVSAEKLDAAGRQFAALLRGLGVLGLYKRDKGHGWHEIHCPWAHEHSDGRDDGAAIAEPSAQNNGTGGFRCHHGHCERRGIDDLRLRVERGLREMARTQRVGRAGCAR